MRRLLNFCRRVLRAVFGRDLTPAWLEKAGNRAAVRENTRLMAVYASRSADREDCWK